MVEKELINKLRELGKVSPRKDWVVLTKSRILGQETESPLIFGIFPKRFFSYKLVLGMVAVKLVFFGFFGFAQNSVPGDFLFSLKRMTERGQAVFVSEQERPQVSLELANRRLEELTRIVEANQVRKLAPAINEFQASVSEAAKSLSRMEATSSDPVVVKNIVEKTKKIGEMVEEVRSLGVVIESEELKEAVNKLEVKTLVSDLETRTLNERQEEILSQMKELAEQEKYTEALELFFLEFNQIGEKENGEDVDVENGDEGSEGEELEEEIGEREN